MGKSKMGGVRCKVAPRAKEKQRPATKSPRGTQEDVQTNKKTGAQEDVQTNKKTGGVKKAGVAKAEEAVEFSKRQLKRLREKARAAARKTKELAKAKKFQDVKTKKRREERKAFLAARYEARVKANEAGSEATQGGKALEQPAITKAAPARKKRKVEQESSSDSEDEVEKGASTDDEKPKEEAYLGKRARRTLGIGRSRAQGFKKRGPVHLSKAQKKAKKATEGGGERAKGKGKGKGSGTGKGKGKAKGGGKGRKR